MNIEDRKDRKELKFIKIVDGVKLMQELYETIPELEPVVEEGELMINLRLFTSGHEITLWAPKEADEHLIRNIVMEHKYQNEFESEVSKNALPGTES